MKMTGWFPADVKPVRVGVYETKSAVLGYSSRWFSYWDGSVWGLAYERIPPAFLSRHTVSYHQNRMWRGLTERAE